MCYNSQNSKSLSSTHQLSHTASYVEVILFKQLGVVCPRLCYECYHHFIKLTFIFPIEKRERKKVASTAVMSILLLLVTLMQ